MAALSSPLLFLVPARAGSVRVPGKNLRLVAGIPLVGWGIRIARLAAARLPGGPHVVACSTDDAEIGAVATAWGADAIIARPPALATATATSVDVAIHALDELATPGSMFRAVVLVQATSPLTHPGDMVAAVERFDGGADSVVSVTPSHPAAWHLGLEAGEGADAHDDVLTGAFYVVAPEVLRTRRRFVEPGRTEPFRVPPDRSIDVDEPLDLVLAEGILAARPVRPLSIGDRAVGGGRAFVIAEAGVNHDGRPELAHRLVDAAADAGADAVKFQTFDPAALAAADAPTADYQRSRGETGSQRAMLERLALPADAWLALQAHARERGLAFLSTPFDLVSADLLDRLDVPAFKVGSGELTNIPFLAALARRGRPMLVSTGMATMVEVADAVDAIASAGDPPLALFHCVSSYPARPEDANLRAIETMRRAFGVPVGWSDHTLGVELPLAAVAAGAVLVEKHVTLDRTMPGPDHAASLEPGELRAMVVGIRAVEAALGTGRKEPVPAEQPIARVARRSLHWRRALPAGAVIAEADLVALRPGTGLSPARAAGLVGRRTRRAVEAGALALEDDAEPGTPR